MKSHRFSFPKTGRYFTSQPFHDGIREVWIVLHGYRQLAEFFLKKFGNEISSHVLLAAPEGMHRFYLNGHSGRVGASWMTKEAREDDIQDYIGFLDGVLTEVLSSFSAEDVQTKKIHVLGFSQGAATAVRWYTASEHSLNDLVLWGGALPPDVDYQYNLQKLNSSNLKVLIGDQDEFIEKAQILDLEKFLKEHQLKYTLLAYEGKHDIYPQVFQTLL